MSSSNFRSLYDLHNERPTIDRGSAGLSILLKDSFRLSTLLLLGALLQTGLTFILPTQYALLPILLVFLQAVISTATQLFSPSAWNKGLGAGIITLKYSAQLPKQRYDSSSEDDDKKSPFSSTPAERGVVVLHLGVRFNHPLGVLCPGGKEIKEVFNACNERVMAYINDKAGSADDFGCLGMTGWQAVDRETSNTTMSVYYFRDLEGLNQFARDPVHRKAWDWYMKEFSERLGYTHIGIFHEAFHAPKGSWETIYMNLPPTLMGTTNIPILNEGTGKTEWVSPIVDATHPTLRRQMGRLGRKVTGHGQ